MSDSRPLDPPVPDNGAAGGWDVSGADSSDFAFVGEDERDAGLAPTLEVVSGAADRRVVYLGQATVTIGRTTQNDLTLKDGSVSRCHARVIFEDGRYVIEDLDSVNGVFLDGSRVQRAPLRTASRITVGKSILLFTQSEPEVAFEHRQHLIEACDLLSGLDGESKSSLARQLLCRYYPAGATILSHSSPIESMFFVASGEVRVVEVNDEGGERLIRVLLPGDYFGERALLPAQRGACALVASSSSCVLELGQDSLAELLQLRPELGHAVRSGVRKRLSTGRIELGRHSDALSRLAPLAEVMIVGADKRILAAKTRIEAMASSASTPLLIGPPGSGRRTFARFFHGAGAGREEPYYELALNELETSTVEATVFGVEADSTTPHAKGKVGYLEMLGAGTLVLADIQLLDAHIQSKLLTYLKLGWFHRSYGRTSVESKTRLVLLATGTAAAVHERLLPELRRELEASTVVLPALAERVKDIPVLAEHFLKLHARRQARRVAGFSREATDRLVSYAWPGNVAELENVVQRAAIVSTEDNIIPGDLIFVAPPEREIHKLNLLKHERTRAILRNPYLLKSFMWINLLVVGVVTGFTLYGGLQPSDHPLQHFESNPGMLITWLIWFPLLPISAVLIGRIWCGMCPIVGFGELVARVKRFNLPVPRILRRLDFWVVVASFLFLDFVEEFVSVASVPWATGMLLVVIVGLATLLCVLYERRTFCRYVCPLAGLLGTYSTMSMVEVRGNKKVCQTQCGQHTCYRGTATTPGCPMFSYPASISNNSECMMCGNCLASCGERGVQLNLRPPLQELWRQSNPALSLSLFGVLLVGMMARHQFSELASWKAYAATLQLSANTQYVIMYFAFLLATLIPFVLASTLSAAASQQRLADNMSCFGMAFIPLALAGHVAHAAHEVLREGLFELLTYGRKLVDLVLHGTAIVGNQVVISPFIHAQVVGLAKLGIIGAGVVGSLVAMVMIARRLSSQDVLARALPHLLLLLAFGLAYLYVFLS